MAIRVITDSASDILQREAKELGIKVLPMIINFDGEEYLDGVNISHREYYEKLIESDVLPKTAQIPVTFYEEAYREVLDEGDTPLVITLSSKLSGTFQSAHIAAEEFPDDIAIVDSENVTVGQRILVLRALYWIRKGLNVKEVVAKLEEEKKEIRLMAVLDTLEYLKKGGRISATAAFAGTVLSIKPVVAVEEGLVAMKGKARGSKNASNLLRQMISTSGGIDFDRPYYVAYSGLTDAFLNKYLEDHGDLWKSESMEVPMATVGATIGTHVGPGAIAVAFFEKQ